MSASHSDEHTVDVGHTCVDDGRRKFLKTAGLVGATAAVLATTGLPALAGAAATPDGNGTAFPLLSNGRNAIPDWIPKVKPGGKKVRIGIRLGYGPSNQPYRRGCWQAVQRILDLGAEPVTVRGQPSAKSERDNELALLDRNIDAMIMGIYLSEQESAFIADKAHKQGVKTVGFAVPVKDSPAVVEDAFGEAITLAYYMQDLLARQGTIAQIAENPGFYKPFDEQVATVDTMTKFESRMKMLPRVQGGVSTQNEQEIARQNITSLLQAHPQKASISAIMSWWWPDTLGTAQALKQMRRTDDIKLFNHYFSDHLLSDWADGTYEIAASTDAPWTIMGAQSAEIAVAMARGHDVPTRTYHVPIRFATTRQEAKMWLGRLASWDKQSVALLKKYGG